MPIGLNAVKIVTDNKDIMQQIVCKISILIGSQSSMQRGTVEGLQKYRLPLKYLSRPTCLRIYVAY